MERYQGRDQCLDLGLFYLDVTEIRSDNVNLAGLDKP